MSSLSTRLPGGGSIFIYRPSEAEIERLYPWSIARGPIDMVPLQLVRAVHKRNRHSLWRVQRLASDAPGEQPTLAGCYGFLLLNEAGRRATQDGSFDALRPDFAMLAHDDQPATLIHVWFVVAGEIAPLATPLVTKALAQTGYGRVPLYADAAVLGEPHFEDKADKAAAWAARPAPRWN